MNLEFILSQITMSRIDDLRRALSTGEAVPGERLRQVMDGADVGDALSLFELLIRTKQPCIYAESAVRGDGSDWTSTELSLLGDVSAAIDVQVFDDGKHHSPDVHAEPFHATLLFTPGALLTKPDFADYREAVTEGTLNEEGYYQLYERRLLPALTLIDALAGARGRDALITVPGIGCGQFAGRFQNRLGPHFERVLVRLLEQHGSGLAHVRMLRFDPHKECHDRTVTLNGIELRTRSYLNGRFPLPQLCYPAMYEESGDDFSACDLYSVVAWDHVSWPGNDFWSGHRSTDDGVKAAATSAMEEMTGFAGRYDPQSCAFKPPERYSEWGELVEAEGLSLAADAPIVLAP